MPIFFSPREQRTTKKEERDEADEKNKEPISQKHPGYRLQETEKQKHS